MTDYGRAVLSLVLLFMYATMIIIGLELEALTEADVILLSVCFGLSLIAFTVYGGDE